jgi:hypothetical protein
VRNEGFVEIFERPPVGMPVFSNDGVHLGHVASVEVRDGWFKVDAPQAPDFWLSLQEIQDVGERHVLLRIPRAEVRARKWEGPEPEPPMLSALGTDRDPETRDFAPGMKAGER